ncbi:MAG: potassium channel protein [Myxococcota bacterium]
MLFPTGMLSALRHYGRHIIDLLLAMRSLSVPVALLVVLTVVGTLGYRLLLPITWLHALYQTVITLSTVGFHEVMAFDRTTQIFTIVLICIGVGTVYYLITMLAAMVFEGEVRRNFRARLLRRTIAGMRQHFIVCGFGRVGGEIAEMLHVRGREFVVIDRDEKVIEQVRSKGLHAVLGDAADETVLEAAGIAHANALVAATTSDAANTYITLTVRKLNPEVCIVARAETRAAAEKLRLAGARHVVSPYAIGARRMTLSALQPMMADVMDALSSGRHGEQVIAEIEVRRSSGLDGKTLSQAFVQGPQTAVLAIRRGDGSLVMAPRGSDVMYAGDRVIVLAEEKHLTNLAQDGAA